MLVFSVPFILTAAAMLGALLLATGLRGRRVDERPRCRRCGYDLSGRPAGSAVCSECGSDLNVPRAVRIGHRERRPGLVASGAVLLVLAATVGGVIVWAQARGFDPAPY